MIDCKAAITDGNGHFTIESITVAPPREDEVLVQLVAAGVCHTDYDSLRWNTPLILGHEGAGIVIEKGSSVSHVNEGDRVLLNWAIPCNHCFQCNEKNYHICENASPVTGGLHGTNLGHADAMGTRRNGQPVSRSFNLGTLSEYTLVKQ